MSGAPSVLEEFRDIFKDQTAGKTVLALLNSERSRRRALQTWVLIVLMFFMLMMYLKAMYNQQEVIHIFNQDIDTSNVGIMEGAVLLGPLLSPQRLALLCEFPGLYAFLGYSSPYTGYVVASLAVLEPSTTRAVKAMVLLEGGLVVDTQKTSPPTLFNEVLRQIYPSEQFVPPHIIKPPSPLKQAGSTISQILPVLMQALFFVPMIF